jgi:hypothetical protein
VADPARPAAIQALYDAFAGCAIPEALSYCTYCDDAAYERSLHAPLPSLPRALVDKYLADAIHHTGSARDFLYFVPRVVECEGERSLTWWFVFADRLKMADWAAWPERQRLALLRALEFVATTAVRDQGWLEVLALVDGIDWPWIFLHWPELEDPTSPEAWRFADCLEWGGLVEASSPVAPLFEAFRESAEGQSMLARLRAAQSTPDQPL